MEKIRNKKITLTVGLLILVALLATVIYGVWTDGVVDNASAYEVSSEAQNAVIGDHGVGKVDVQLAQGQETKVRERHGVSADTEVVWIHDENELKTNLQTSTAAASNVAAGKILIFANDIDWRQSSIANDVGTQKFSGILDGNGYSLDIYFTAPMENGGTAKSNNDNNAYYKVTQSDIGESTNNFSGTDGGGARGIGLVVGVNAGTIANLTVNYSAMAGAMQGANTTGSGGVSGNNPNSLDSAENPDLPYGYGIVTGINIGTIKNVYVNQQSIFTGNTKARTDFNGNIYTNNAESYENCAAVGGITGINMGYGVINNCYMYVGDAIWAHSDGSNSNGSDIGARYACTFAGGIAGWIRGDNSQLTYSYLDGKGEINSWAMRGDNLSMGDQIEPWSMAYAGGITAGKIQLYRETNSTLGVSRENCYANAQAMGANQVKGIISNWTGTRKDSYGQTALSSDTYPARSAVAMPFDFLYSADQGTDKQDLIVFTFNYKAVSDSDTLDMAHNGYNGKENSSAKMNANWTEVYGWKHALYDGDSTVSVTFEGNYLRIQAKSDTFMDTQETQLESITRNTNPNGYQPKYDGTYQGSFIWGTDIYTIGSGVNPETTVSSTVHKATDQLGSFVQYYGTTMSKGSYVVKFGATYDYRLVNASTTARQFNGDPITDMLPSLVLTDKNGAETTVKENDGLFAWNFTSASSGAVDRNLTLYPDIYYIQPYAKIANPDAAEGEPAYTINQNYAYYDESQRTLAVNKGISATVVVSKATLALSYGYSDQWVSDATIGVTLTADGYPVNKQIIDAYSYQGGTTNDIIDIGVSSNNAFNIIESTTTPQNGKTIYNVTAYVKKSDGTYVAVADTSRAPAANKTALIKVDRTAPVLVEEKYYLADQFSAYTTLKEMYDAWKAEPDKFQTIEKNDILNGKWFNKEIIAFATVSDENRSGISTIGVDRPSGLKDGTDFYIANDGSDSVVLIRVKASSDVVVTPRDVRGNSVSISLNGGNYVNIDTTPITLKPILSNDIYVTYSYREAYGKAFSKLGIQFNATFGGSGLKVWYYIDESGNIGNDVTSAPEDANWVEYKFDTEISSGATMTMLIPESMTNAAVFVKFSSGVDGYDVAEPIVKRAVSGSYYTFTVDLSGADIVFKSEYIEVRNTQTGATYPLGELMNGNYSAVNLADFFSKSYDGTVSLNPAIEFGFTVDENTPLMLNNHYTGTFYASNEQSNFRTSWLQIVAEYTGINAGECFLNVYITTTEASPVEMKISIDYGGEIGSKQTLSVPTYINKLNMKFDINQIFTEGANISMSKGSYTSGESGNVTFNWMYGDVFDGLEVSILNDESGGTMYFRFKCQGKTTENYMNVGGNYTAYVDAIKIDSPVYQMDDFAELVKSGDVYVGEAGDNYTVEISGTIGINVQQKEVRLTFALDGLTRYSFKIPYDLATHTVTAAYTDVNGQTQYADIVWYKDGAASTLKGITDIGEYTAVANIKDGNYKIKGQSQQTITIIATYLDVLVPDKTVQYNDGKAVTYIPDLPEGSAAEGKDIVYTITYYQKLGNSLKLLGVNYEITEVGEYYVSVLFDPEAQTDPELKKFARKEYSKEESSAAAGSNNYTAFTVVKADTVIGGVENQISVYNTSKQILDKTKAVVKSASSGVTVSNSSVKLQYWDEASGTYVDFNENLNDGKYENVGVYMYKLVYDGNENYNPSYIDLTLTINAAEISNVWFGDQIKDEDAGILGIKQVYNGKAVSLAADISQSNVGKDTDVVVEYKKFTIGTYSEDVPEYINVGRYQVWLRVSCGDNYLPYETSAYVIISTAPYPEDAINFTNGKIATFEYDGKEHAIEYTLNTGKYGTGIVVTESNTKQKEAGEYVGTVQVTLANYEGYTYQTVLTITPKKVATVDTSSISEIQQEQGLTSDTDLTQIKVTFSGVDGKTVEAELTFWDEEGNIVIPDSYGCLPAGTYKVTYSAGDNYDLSAVNGGTLTLAEGTGERPCDHVDANGDGLCDKCGANLKDEDQTCQHEDKDGDGKCDKCGASLGSVTPPKEAPNVALYVILAVCGVLVVAAVAGVVIAAVVKSKKKKNNRYNII